jgi:hypothetical protein
MAEQRGRNREGAEGGLDSAIEALFYVGSDGHIHFSLAEKRSRWRWVY